LVEASMKISLKINRLKLRQVEFAVGKRSAFINRLDA
jgi:hypothetical protein